MSKNKDRTTAVGRTGTKKAHQSHSSVLMTTDRHICLAWSSGRNRHTTVWNTRMPHLSARRTSGLDAPRSLFCCGREGLREYGDSAGT